MFRRVYFKRITLLKLTFFYYLRSWKVHPKNKFTISKMEHLGLGLQLMIVGMLTVFTILLIVIWGGKLLITAVNKLAPEEELKPVKKQSPTPIQDIDATTMAVLEQVVSKITGGKGSVKSVKKV